MLFTSMPEWQPEPSPSSTAIATNGVINEKRGSEATPIVLLATSHLVYGRRAAADQSISWLLYVEMTPHVLC